MGGVRTSKVKERSGRTVMRAGIGVPVMKWAVRALNSWLCVLVVCAGGRGAGGRRVCTLQKSIDFTPLEPRAGPTGGEGEACPAPTMSLTMTSLAIAFLAIGKGGRELT